jgi:hypothetical protein
MTATPIKTTRNRLSTDERQRRVSLVRLSLVYKKLKVQDRRVEPIRNRKLVLKNYPGKRPHTVWGGGRIMYDQDVNMMLIDDHDDEDDEVEDDDFEEDEDEDDGAEDEVEDDNVEDDDVEKEDDDNVEDDN